MSIKSLKSSKAKCKKPQCFHATRINAEFVFLSAKLHKNAVNEVIYKATDDE